MRRYNRFSKIQLVPTIIHGSEAINVIPSEVVLELDGRMLPGVVPRQFIQELRQRLGKTLKSDTQIDVLSFDPPAKVEPDLSQFNLLADALKTLDPEGIPLPNLLPGVSDARFFATLGIQTYGFTPMKLPSDF